MRACDGPLEWLCLYPCMLTHSCTTPGPGHIRLRRLLEQEPIPGDAFLPPDDSNGSNGAPWTGGVVSQFSSMVRAGTQADAETAGPCIHLLTAPPFLIPTQGSHAQDGKYIKEEFEPTLLTAKAPRLPSTAQVRRLRSHVVWPRLADVAGSLEVRACTVGNKATGDF